jgi:hypothetical protein
MAKTDTPISPNLAGKPDFIARYFLRRLAMAHREAPARKPSIQHINALVETILLFVGMPMISVASVVLIGSIRWGPQVLSRSLGASPLTAVFILWSLSVVIGQVLLGRKFEKYRDDRSAYLQLNTDRDFKIASRQKVTVFIACGIVLPLLAMYVTFGNQVFTRAFDLH